MATHPPCLHQTCHDENILICILKLSVPTWRPFKFWDWNGVCRTLKIYGFATRASTSKHLSLPWTHDRTERHMWVTVKPLSFMEPPHNVHQRGLNARRKHLTDKSSDTQSNYYPVQVMGHELTTTWSYCCSHNQVRYDCSKWHPIPYAVHYHKALVKISTVHRE
jgi:hypothetical protein